MNNPSSYCGLVDAKIRASDKDLPVPHILFQATSWEQMELMVNILMAD